MCVCVRAGCLQLHQCLTASSGLVRTARLVQQQAVRRQIAGRCSVRRRRRADLRLQAWLGALSRVYCQEHGDLSADCDHESYRLWEDGALGHGEPAYPSPLCAVLELQEAVCRLFRVPWALLGHAPMPLVQETTCRFMSLYGLPKDVHGQSGQQTRQHRILDTFTTPCRGDFRGSSPDAIAKRTASWP